MARILEIAGRRGFYRATCLRRSPVLWWWLRRLGLAGHLRIGVRQDSGRLEAHAWVESQGRIVIGDLPGGFSQFTRLPRLPDAWPGGST